MKTALFCLCSSVLCVSAAYAEPTDYSTSKKAKKIAALMQTLGLNDPRVMALINDVHQRTKKGYFSLYEERVAKGKLVLHYELQHGIDKDQLELRFTPADDSLVNYTLRPNALMANYQLKF